jgi:hypothetical protein
LVEGVGDGKDQVADAFAGGGGNRVEREIALFAEVAELFEACAVGGGVEFGGYDDHWLFAEAFAESKQLAIDDFKRADGIGVDEIAGIDQMNKDARAFHMAQKPDAEAGAFMRAFNQAGKIGDDEGAADIGGAFVGASAGLRNAVGADDSEIRFEGGEWVIGNFGARGGDYGNQRGFASVGKTDEADVGEQFEFEAQVALFAGMAVFVFSRRLMPRLREMLVATAAATTMRNQDALAGCG